MIQLVTSPILFNVIATAELAAGSASKPSVLGAVALGLVLGFVQLIVGLSIAAFAINKGIQIVSKMLEGIDI